MCCVRLLRQDEKKTTIENKNKNKNICQNNVLWLISDRPKNISYTARIYGSRTAEKYNTPTTLTEMCVRVCLCMGNYVNYGAENTEQHRRSKRLNDYKRSIHWIFAFPAFSVDYQLFLTNFQCKEKRACVRA